LWNTCLDDSLRGRLADVVAKMTGANREAGELRAAIARHRDSAKADRDHADSLAFDRRSEDLRKRADEHDAEVVRLPTRLKAVEKEMAAFQKHEAAIRDEMLVP
jgi:uncharacterized coiled-coil DUF342 family protein